jgi:hypothetical protein
LVPGFFCRLDIDFYNQNCMSPSVFLFTDFTVQGPYVGLMHSRIAQVAPEVRVFDLMHDAPVWRPDLAAHLLPAVCRDLPAGAVVCAVVDPGVGGARRPLVVETTHALFVGPDNGLLSRLPDIRRVSVIDWRPDDLSASFHGRDLFAPVAARLARGDQVRTTSIDVDAMAGSDWPEATPAIVYIDAFGNLMTGVDLKNHPEIKGLLIDGRPVPRARTFSDVPPGSPFWYENSLGLLEIAVNGGSAAQFFGLALGDKILLE